MHRGLGDFDYFFGRIFFQQYLKEKQSSFSIAEGAVARRQRYAERTAAYNSSYAVGGVSCANCGYDSSSSFTNIGSRLAFRGEIEEAESVTAFKAIKAILA